MAIIQALFAFLTRSAGKILNAIFGWAVVALFGRTTSKQQTVLSVIVGAAAIWPLLLLGIVVPKFVTFVVGFIPLWNKVPSAWVRPVWIILAALVPLAVGMAVAAKSPPGAPKESVWKRL